MSRIHDYNSRVDIVSTDPLIATLTFETDYSTSGIRVSYDSEIGKYWIQFTKDRFHRNTYRPSDICSSLSDINASVIAATIHFDTLRDHAEGLSAAGVEVTGIDDEVWVTAPERRMSREDLRAFALHVIREFDTRYVPSLEEVEREVVSGLKMIGEAAARVGEVA